MLASPSSSTTPMNLALFLSKVWLTLLYLIQRGFTELTSISVAVASPLEKMLLDISSCFAIAGFRQLQNQNNQKLFLPSPSSKYFIS
jgi:hypothetical protein